jgi:microcystin-dependent protein
MKHTFSANLKKSSAFILILLTTLPAFPQVGFDNPNPDSSALIDMKSKDKGLLIPRMSTDDRTAMSLAGRRPAHSLLVFDIDQNIFFTYDTVADPDRWIALNPFLALSSASNVGLGTTSAPVEKLEVNGNVKANQFIGYGTIPCGGIVMWTGSVIPSGWALCDGSSVNGFQTPDLRERFIVGAGGNNPGVPGTGYAVGNTAGVDQVTLTSSQSGLPSHSHGVSDPGHSHTINDPGHSHSIPTSGVANSNTSIGRFLGPDNGFNSSDPAYTGVTINTKTTGISILGSVSQNAAQPFDNRPSYYALAFIMRVQ